MRRIKEELHSLSSFMLDQFFEKEEMQVMFKDINPKKAKKLSTDLLYYELLYMFKKGDIFIYDDNIGGAIVGIESKKLMTISRFFLSLKASKQLKQLTKEELSILEKNIKIIKEVHSSN